MANRVLDIEDLKVSFFTYAGEVQAVRGVTLHVDEGEVLAIVGESGCGKSVTAQTIMKLNPMPPAQIMGGKIQLGEHDIIAASDKEMQDIRGKDVAMIFLEILRRIVSILVGVVTLAKECKSYIQRSKGRTVKDPSASLPKT